MRGLLGVVAFNGEVEFSTARFAIEAGEDEETNSGVYGKKPAEWLADALRRTGVEVQGVIAEDFGRCVMPHRKPFMLWIGCACMSTRLTPAAGWSGEG